MSLAHNPYNQYKKQSVNTSTPEKLLIMLFDGAIRFSGQARLAIGEKDFAKANTYLCKCQDIISEFMNTLNMDYPISKDLYQLYEYIHHQYVQGNIHKDIKYLDEGEKYLRELRETWVQASKLAKATGGETGESL